jgi:hypothetical protein
MVRYSEEDMYHPMAAYQGPDLAGFYQDVGQRSLQNSQQTQEMLNRAAETRAQGRIKSGETLFGALGNLPGQAINSYEKVQDMKDKAEQRRQRAEQSEEALASSRQTREFAAEKQPFDVKSTKAQSDVAETAAAQSKRQEEFETAAATAKDAQPGETNAAYRQRKETELAGLNVETQKLNNELAKSNNENTKAQLKIQLANLELQRQQTAASIKATEASTALTGVQTKVAQTELAKGINDQQVAQYTARLLAPKSEAEVAQVIKTMEKEGATPGQIGQAIQKMREAKLNNQLVQNAINAASPQYQATIRAQTDSETYARTAASLASNLKQFKNSSTFGADDKGPIEAIIKTLENQGKQAEADRLRSRFEYLGGLNQVTRSDRAAGIINDFIGELEQDLLSRPTIDRNDPAVQAAVQSLRNTRMEISGISLPTNKNPFMPNFGTDSITPGGATPGPYSAPAGSGPLVPPIGATPRGVVKVGNKQ